MLWRKCGFLQTDLKSPKAIVEKEPPIEFDSEEYNCTEEDNESLFDDGIIIGMKLKKGEEPIAFLNILDKEGAAELLAGAILDVAETKTCTVYLDHLIRYMQVNTDEAPIITSALAMIKNSINLDEENEIAVRPTEVFSRE